MKKIIIFFIALALSAIYFYGNANGLLIKFYDSAIQESFMAEDIHTEDILIDSTSPSKEFEGTSKKEVYLSANTEIESQTGYLAKKLDAYGNPISNELSYRNLLAPEHQKAYDQIYFSALNCTPKFLLNANVTEAEFSNIYEAVKYDNPEIFWLNYYCNYYYDTNTSLVKEVSLNYNVTLYYLDKAKAEFKNSTQSVLELALEIEDKTSQIKFIHDILTNVNDYDNYNALDQSAYSAVVSKKSVCAGYAAAFQFYMQKLGVPCATIIGASEGTPHAWNIIKLDGDFYEIDVTWDDPVGNAPGNYYYNYFLINNSKTQNDRLRNDMSKLMPIAQGEKYFFEPGYGGKGSDFTGLNYGSPSGALINYEIWGDANGSQNLSRSSFWGLFFNEEDLSVSTSR
ncbi:MAG: hypothetical protein LBV08_10500 [Clostridiales bacterium]|jgi:hypothetical protein|nr:hypothetical protein [Clostridiales bacterium]